MRGERLDEFFVCLACREILAGDELVAEATRETQAEYLARVYPGGYDGQLPRLRSSQTRWARFVRWLND